MEPQFFDTHCHLDLMLGPDAAASESAALGLGLFDCGVDPRDFFRPQTSAPVAYRASSLALGSTPVARRRPLRSCRSRSALRSCCPRALHRRGGTRLFRTLCRK